MVLFRVDSVSATEGRRRLMVTELQPGAEIEHDGMLIGSVERVIDDGPGEQGAVLVRLGRADYLLRIPGRYLTIETPLRACIDTKLDLDDLERTAIEAGRAPPTGNHFQDGGHVEPS